MTRWSVVQGTHSGATRVSREYAVRVVHLQMPPDYRRRPCEGAAGGPSLRAAVREVVAARTSATSSSRRVKAADTPGERRAFKLPPSVHVQAVKQTLIQTDV